MLIIEVDYINTEALKTGIASLLDIFGPTIDARLTLRGTHVAEFRRNDVIVPPAGDGAAYQFLVLTRAIKIRAVEKIDADVRRPVQSRDGILFTAGAVKTRQDHTTKSDQWYFELTNSKSSGSHVYPHQFSAQRVSTLS